jgi:hypothetical protein
MATPDASFMYMIHHVFLPPKLPNHGDGRGFATTDRVLLRFVDEALSFSETCSATGQDPNVHTVSLMLKQMTSILDKEGVVSEKLLLQALGQLPSQGRNPFSPRSPARLC